jgi:hypothetical protein
MSFYHQWKRAVYHQWKRAVPILAASLRTQLSDPVPISRLRDHLIVFGTMP